MAKSISAEELQLKKRARRRLIGAIALVTIVAVFLPMVLDHEPRPVVQDINIQIPSPGSGTFTSKIVPLPPGPSDGKSAAKSAAEPPKAEPPKSDTAATATPPAAVAAAPEAKPAAETPAKPPAFDTEAAPPKKAEPAPKPAAKKAAPKPAAKSAPAPKAAAKPADAKSAGGFVVQVAALNDADKAKQMRDSIAASGIKSYTEVVPTVKGNVTRVRAGPFASRAEAEKMRDKLKDMGLSGNIVPK